MAWAQKAKSGLRKILKESTDTPLRVSLAVGLGVFMALTPLWGVHAVLALALAHVFHLNKVLAVLSSQISIPPLVPFIVFASILTGRFLLGSDMSASLIPSELTFEAASLHFREWIVGSLVLAPLAGAVSVLAVFLLLKFRLRLKVQRANSNVKAT